MLSTLPHLDRSELHVPGGANTRLAKQPIWLLLAWLLIAGGLWDAAGLIAGPRSYWSSPTYQAVRSFPGGIRPVGVVLLIIVLLLVWNLATSSQLGLKIACTAGFIYYLFWLLGVLLSWHSTGVVVWGAPVKSAFLAAVYLILVTKIDDRRGA